MTILIALPQLMRKHLALFTYTVGCGVAIPVAWFFMFPNAARASAFPTVFALYASGYVMDWPWSIVYQIAFLTTFQAAIVAVALIAHLAFSHQLRRRTLLRALPVVFFVLAISNVALPLVSELLTGVKWFGGGLLSVPGAIALVLGNLKATRCRGSVIDVKSV